VSRSLVHRPTRQAILASPCRSLVYPWDPTQFTRYRSRERSPSSSPSRTPPREPAWPNPFAETLEPEGELDPEALQKLTIFTSRPTPWKDSRLSRALALSRLQHHRPGTTEQQAEPPAALPPPATPPPATPTPPPVPPRTDLPPPIPLRINLPPLWRPPHVTKHRINLPRPETPFRVGLRPSEKPTFDVLRFLGRMNHEEL